MRAAWIGAAALIAGCAGPDGAGYLAAWSDSARKGTPRILGVRVNLGGVAIGAGGRGDTS